MLVELYHQYKIIIWICVGLIVLGGLGFGLYRLLVFQVIASNPSNNSEISAGATTIAITYNKDIQINNSNDQVLASAKIIKNTEVKGNTLLINLINLQQDADYQLYLKNITSTDGQVLPLYVFNFHNKYIPFDKQSKEMQDQAVSNTDKGNIDDAAMKALPKTTSTFSITYELLSQPDQKGKYIKIKIALLLLNYELNDKVKIAEYKKQALDYLKSQGVNPQDYTIEYFPSSATNL